MAATEVVCAGLVSAGGMVVAATGASPGPDSPLNLTTIVFPIGNTRYCVGDARSSTSRVMRGFALRSRTRISINFPRLTKILCKPALGSDSGRSTINLSGSVRV